MDDTDDAVDVARANERSAQVPLGVMPDDNGRYADPDEKASDDFDQAGGNVRFAKKPTSPRKDTYGDGPPSALSNSTRSVGPDGQPLSPQLGRRPSVMQRIFAGAKKSSKVSSFGSFPSPSLPFLLYPPGLIFAVHLDGL